MDAAARRPLPAPAGPVVVSVGAGLARVAIAGAAVALVASVALTVTGRLSGSGSFVLTGIAVAACIAATAAVVFALSARLAVGHARSAQLGGDLARCRELAADSRASSWRSLSAQLVGAILVMGLLVVSANDAAIQDTFLQWNFMRDSAPEVLKAFKTNIVIAIAAEAFVLVFALVLAVVRLLPGPEARPIRALAIAYIDVFRGLPVIVVVYLVGFGLPLAGLPVLGNLSATWYAIIALTLSHNAYVAEVFRAGVQSVHPSQSAAARSLGLSHMQTMRYVVVPQAVRAVVAPLLGFFVALQKDTALIGVVGTIDAFQQAKIYSSTQFNLSSVVLVSIVFVALTIPQTRMVDWLIARDMRRKGVR